MKSSFKFTLLAGLLMAAGFSYSQAPMDGGDCDNMMGRPGKNHMGQMDPDKMQAMFDKRHAAQKAQLKLTAEQESAWTTFTTAMRPDGSMMANRPDPAEMAKLTTPERIEKMKAVREQHVKDMFAAMDRRGEATKVFYATLTPEQQKVFDATAMPRFGKLHGAREGRGMGRSPKP